jgi:hypothetical protein
MAESVEQYVERILSNVGDADPWEVLASTAARLRALIDGRPADALTRRPAPHRWSVGEILAHLADAEVVAGWRLRSILASNGTPLQPFDQDRWAETFRYAQAPAHESLEAFDASRRANLHLLRSVDPALLDNYGVHAERGRESVHHLLRLYAGHDVNHLRQIERLLA